MDAINELLNLEAREDIADEFSDTFTQAKRELIDQQSELTRLRDALQRISVVAAGTWAGNYAEIILDGGRTK